MPAPVDLYWIPLGAGGHCVRLNGIVYEALAAARERRPRCDVYHSALIVDGVAIEVAPEWSAGAPHGVPARGAVGSRLLGRSALFRYEVRCGGVIPDLAEAVGGPHRVADDPATARRVLAAVRDVPAPVWGRDELHAGEWWTCNSVVSYALTWAGLPAADIHPPPGGRAPGWQAGIRVALRGPDDQHRAGRVVRDLVRHGAEQEALRA